MPLREQQLQYEIDSDIQAAANRLEKLRADSLAGDLNAPKATRFIARAYTAVAHALEVESESTMRGTAAKFKRWIRAIPADMAAVIAIREVVRICTSAKRTSPATLQVLGSAIGRLYELEVRINQAEQVNPLYMKRIHDQVQDNATTNQRHLGRLYNVAFERVMKGEFEDKLTNADTIQVGKFGVQACMDAGILKLTKMDGPRGSNSICYYELAPEVHEFLTDYTSADVSAIMDKAAGAMMCPPEPWTTLIDGGYLSSRRKLSCPLMPLSDIRKTERRRLREEFTAEKMPKVFAAANYLQAQSFRTHAPTLHAIKRVWTGGGGVMGIPKYALPTAPPCPLPPEWIKSEGTPEELDTLYRWKRLAHAHYESLKEWRSKVREIGGFIKHATKSTGPMWFPAFMDKRGRWYYRGSPNPQGSDIAKATLHFANTKPLGDAGVYWLKVHIANCFGFDKERFDVRAKWTDDNWHTIQGALDAPEDHAEVWGTDAPWCMFSAAWELRAALASGNPKEYCTGIPIHMDATCSGLQHFSAMLRDPVGGGYVNLYDEEFVGPKQDIYSKVSTNAMAAIARDTESKAEGIAAMAAWWLKTGISRTMAKKPVMTYCYGATVRGTTEFVQGHVEYDLGIPWPEGIRPYDYCQYAAIKLFTGIASTVPSAEATMQWLKSVAKAQPKGKRMEWTSPTGFLVQHDYQDYDEVRVKIRSCGMTAVLVRDYNDSTRAVPMQNAVAPNFVHALDASHLTYTALAMGAAGLSMVGIHDSFGTHPCDVSQMHTIIREEFVSMYSSNSVLNEFLWQVGGTGNAPMRGTLDLSKVLSSEFFFC